MIVIREAVPSDWPQIWRVVEPVFRQGETYPFAREIPEGEARVAWMERTAARYVALDAMDSVVGTYYIRPNQPGLGAHVCNCGYVVSEAARGQGVATRMCEHSQDEARRRGFRAMQFNLVVSTNESAFRLWQKLGFELVGTLPGAFLHARRGYVDAHVMYKRL